MKVLHAFWQVWVFIYLMAAHFVFSFDLQCQTMVDQSSHLSARSCRWREVPTQLKNIFIESNIMLSSQVTTNSNLNSVFIFKFFIIDRLWNKNVLAPQWIFQTRMKSYSTLLLREFSAENVSVAQINSKQKLWHWGRWTSVDFIDKILENLDKRFFFGGGLTLRRERMLQLIIRTMLLSGRQLFFIEDKLHVIVFLRFLPLTAQK